VKVKHASFAEITFSGSCSWHRTVGLEHVVCTELHCRLMVLTSADIV